MTTLVVDDTLLHEAVQLGHHKSTQEAVVKALEHYIQYVGLISDSVTQQLPRFDMLGYGCRLTQPTALIHQRHINE